ncbi:MAG: hypothetical protein V3T58_06595 [Candidatus Hydrothermarchaeales archaeon]
MANVWLIADFVLIALSIVFGLQAIVKFKNSDINSVFKTLNNKKRHKTSLLYSTIFLGITFVAIGIIQGFRYVMEIEVAFRDLIFTLFYLSFLAITYSWYALLKEVPATN